MRTKFVIHFEHWYNHFWTTNIELVEYLSRKLLPAQVLFFCKIIQSVLVSYVNRWFTQPAGGMFIIDTLPAPTTYPPSVLCINIQITCYSSTQLYRLIVRACEPHGRTRHAANARRCVSVGSPSGDGDPKLTQRPVLWKPNPDLKVIMRWQSYGVTEHVRRAGGQNA